MRRMRVALYLVVPAWALSMLVPAAAPAAVDMFLQVDGIKGESSDFKFKDAIDIQSFSWEVSNSRQQGPGGEGSARRGAATFSDLQVTKRVDAASPVLLLRAASGQTIPNVKLILVKSGQEQQQFLRICLTDSQVTSLSQSGSGGEVPSESVSFSYRTIVETYLPQKADGSLGTPIVGGWDVVRNLQYGPGAC